jgi:hypothetical protein
VTKMMTHCSIVCSRKGINSSLVLILLLYTHLLHSISIPDMPSDDDDDDDFAVCYE